MNLKKAIPVQELNNFLYFNEGKITILNLFPVQSDKYYSIYEDTLAKVISCKIILDANIKNHVKNYVELIISKSEQRVGFDLYNVNTFIKLCYVFDLDDCLVKLNNYYLESIKSSSEDEVLKAYTESFLYKLNLQNSISKKYKEILAKDESSEGIYIDLIDGNSSNLFNKASAQMDYHIKVLLNTIKNAKQVPNTMFKRIEYAIDCKAIKAFTIGMNKEDANRFNSKYKI